MSSADAYELKRNQHRPTDRAALTAEIRRLMATGLRVRDVAECMRLNDADVINLLTEYPA